MDAPAAAILSSDRSPGGVEAVQTALAAGLAHGPRFGVSPTLVTSLPPGLPAEDEAPPVISTLMEMRHFVQQLEALYRQNHLLPDALALVQTSLGGDRRDHLWWRRYRLGWLARRFVVDGGDGVIYRTLQSLIGENSPHAACDLAIFFADLCRFTASSRKTGGLRIFFEYARRLSPTLRRTAAWHLCGWISPEREADFSLWMKEAGAEISAAGQEALRSERRFLAASAGRLPVPGGDSYPDGWPERPAAVAETGMLALMSALDYRSIYTIPQLVEMALYNPDRSVAARSLYALVDHGRQGMVSGEAEDRAICRLLLSPFGPGWVQRVGGGIDLLWRLSEHLTYQRAIRDVAWAEACSILCKFSAGPLLPVPTDDRRLALADRWPRSWQWARPADPEKDGVADETTQTMVF